MFNVVKKLLLARQLQMEKGRISLLSKSVVISPITVFSNMIAEARENKDPTILKNIYHSAKESGKNYTEAMQKKYGLNGEKLMNWCIDIVTLSGWGELKVIKFDMKEKILAIQVVNSTLSEELKNQGIVVDYMIAGYIAGGCCTLFKEDWDTLEIKCSSKGDHLCEFISKPTNQIHSDIIPRW